jgi:hypothetical protein
MDEFLVWDAADLTGRRWQLIDGEPVLRALLRITAWKRGEPERADQER